MASRCVRIELRPVPPAELRDWLMQSGMDGELAEELAEAAGGSIDRARLLADDAGFADRRLLWRSVPSRLDGTGSAAAASGGGAAVLGRRSRGAAAGPAPGRDGGLGSDAEQRGERSVPRRKEIEDRQHREERRWRTDELRAGFAVLAARLP